MARIKAISKFLMPVSSLLLFASIFPISHSELHPVLVARKNVYGEQFDDGWPGPDDDLFMDEVYPD